MRRRVVVTGIGVVSPIGVGTAAFLDSLRSGRSGIGRIESIDVEGLGFENGAQVRGFDPESRLDDRAASTLDRFGQFAVLAAREAVEDAGVAWAADERSRVGVVLGSCLGGMIAQDRQFHSFYGRGAKRVHPLTVPRVMANAGASGICLDLGITGPSLNFSTACSSSNHAIGHAFRMIRDGSVDACVTGGAETPFALGHLKAWEAMRVVAPDTCRPFARDRKGMILGEGSAALVLECAEEAEARGAEIYGEIVGFGMSSDAYHLTSSSMEGPAAAMRAALADGGLEPEEVGYINAHGTGTRANDPTEVAAIRKVFEETADRLAVSSTKSLHGHSLGAAGAMELAATVLALHHGFLPPTANFTDADPECDLDVIPNQARSATVDVAVSNSFAFGGTNAVLALKRWTS